MASIPTTLMWVVMLALEGLIAPLGEPAFERHSEVEAPSVGGSKVARLQLGRSLQKHWVAPPPSFKHFNPLANSSPRAGMIPSGNMRRLIFIGPRCPWGPIYGWICPWVSETPCWNLTDVTLADQATNSIPNDKGNRAMQVTQSGGQLWNQCKWRHLMTKL